MLLGWKVAAGAGVALIAVGAYATLENAWRKKAELDVAVEKAINVTNTTTIANLNDWRAANQETMMWLAGQLEAERKREDEERTEIDKLAETDAEVKKWRATPLPVALQRVLNKKPGKSNNVPLP